MIVAVVTALAGGIVMALTALSHRRAEGRAMDELMGLSGLPAFFGENDEEDRVNPLAGRAAELAGQVVERVDRGRLGHALDQAKIPLRPGEYVIVTAGCGLALAAVLLAATGNAGLAVAAPVATGLGAAQLLRLRVSRRRRAFEAQLPDALALIASSLSAGHTFLRAIQMMCEESDPPLADEFGRVVAETRLGGPVVDALGRMAGRLQVRDLDIVVQAIRIQQTVGGRLAELLHTLADFMRARDEIRREVRVLTAEGRMSAYVLAATVPFLVGAIQVMNPDYIAPLYKGWGLVILALCGASVVAGMLVILRMVKIEV